MFWVDRFPGMSVGTLLAIAICGTSVHASQRDVVAECEYKELRVFSQETARALACSAKIAKGNLLAGYCESKERASRCPWIDRTATRNAIVEFVNTLALDLHSPGNVSLCAARKISALRSYLTVVLREHALLGHRPFPALAKKIAVSRSKVRSVFERAEAYADCLVTSDADSAISLADQFAMQAVARGHGGFNHVILLGETIPGPNAIAVSLLGALRYSRRGQFVGAVGIFYGSDGLAVLDARAGEALRITVGSRVATLAGVAEASSTVLLTGIQAGALTIDATSVSANSVMETYLSDVASGEDPASWSPGSQALLALGALAQAEGWKLNAAATSHRYSHVAPLSAQRSTPSDNLTRSKEVANSSLRFDPQFDPSVCDAPVPLPFCNPLPPIPNPCQVGPIDLLDCSSVVESVLDPDAIDACEFAVDCQEAFCDVASTALVSSITGLVAALFGPTTPGIDAPEVCAIVCATLVATPIPVVDEGACVATCLVVGAAATIADYAGSACSDPPPSPANPTPPDLRWRCCFGPIEIDPIWTPSGMSDSAFACAFEIPTRFDTGGYCEGMLKFEGRCPDTLCGGPDACVTLADFSLGYFGLTGDTSGLDYQLNELVGPPYGSFQAGRCPDREP